MLQVPGTTVYAEKEKEIRIQRMGFLKHAAGRRASASRCPPPQRLCLRHGVSRGPASDPPLLCGTAFRCPFAVLHCLSPRFCCLTDLDTKQRSTTYDFMAHGYTSNDLNPKQQVAYDRAHGNMAATIQPRYSSDHLP